MLTFTAHERAPGEKMARGRWRIFGRSGFPRHSIVSGHLLTRAATPLMYGILVTPHEDADR